jgi:hypothetical protein
MTRSLQAAENAGMGLTEVQVGEGAVPLVVKKTPPVLSQAQITLESPWDTAMAPPVAKAPAGLMAVHTGLTLGSLTFQRLLS